MQTRTTLAAAAVLAAGALLGWLTASGRLTTVLAQDTQPPSRWLPRRHAAAQARPGVQGQGRRDVQGLDARATRSRSRPPRAARTCSHPARRRRLRHVLDVRRAGPDADTGQAREERAEVQPVPHHGAVLARRARRCWPAATTTASAPASSSRWAPASPATPGIIPRSTALVSEILRDNGYATAMFGKWHNTPEPDISPAGPFDRWPTGLGFDYFYGFNQGETHQYYPTLYRNTIAGAAAEVARAGLPLHRGHDRRGHRLDAQRPRRRPRTSRGSCYFSTGAAHAPHHAPKEWRDKYKGKFDHGWDKQREMTHAKQNGDGRHPEGHEAHPAAEGDPGVGRPAGRREDRCTRRLMENYAAFMAHTDHHVGRLIDSLEQSGELDNTLVFYIVGDNGASAEGGLEGTFSEVASLLGCNSGLAEHHQADRRDRRAGRASRTSRSAGRGRWTRRSSGPSRSPATSAARATRWSSTGPRASRRRANSAPSSTTCIDVVPTILEACKVPEPKAVNGIPQKPIEGVSACSTRSTTRRPRAGGRRSTSRCSATGRSTTTAGWRAASFGMPWDTAGRAGDFLKAPWELYHIEEDFSQADDLAAKNPEKLKELQAQVPGGGEEVRRVPARPPVGRADRPAELGSPASRRRAGPTSATTSGCRSRSGRIVYPNSPHHHCRADHPGEGHRGRDRVLPAASPAGGRLYVKDGKPTYHYNFVDFEHRHGPGQGRRSRGEGDAEAGVHLRRAEAEGHAQRRGNGEALRERQAGGRGRASERRCSATASSRSRSAATRSPRSARTTRARATFAFTGTIEKITFEAKPSAG